MALFDQHMTNGEQRIEVPHERSRGEENFHAALP
jgi:hypothetical protein